MTSILHLGNIANNAFLNARLLRRAGIDSTVICYDYFDPLATPEWDEARFPEGVEMDSAKPDWTICEDVYHRPGWFLQGYAASIQKYFVDGNRERIDRESGLTKNHDMKFWWYRQRARLFHHSKRLRLVPRRWGKFIKIYSELFPDRKPLSYSDLSFGLRWAHGWENCLKKFDLVQAYACDPVIPMLLGIPFFAFEHGTLRDIPFEDSARGRLTALSYALAEHVFVTNFDCLENAHTLVNDEKRVSFINHPYNENQVPDQAKSAEIRQRLQRELDADYLLFFPTRHDWVEGDGYHDKSNDIFIRAASNLLTENNKRIGLILCNWGHNQKQTAKLIQDLGLSGRTKWVSPLPYYNFSNYCGASDIVADQFKLGSFGGIFFKALGLGAPVCTYIDESKFLRAYSELPNIINGNRIGDLTSKLDAYLSTPTLKVKMSEDGKKWMRRFHSSDHTVTLQIREYQRFLDRQAPTRIETIDQLTSRPR